MPEQVPLYLAPMAGVTDLPFRLLARECGADITITEFTPAAALTRSDAKSWQKLSTSPDEKPFIPQIFGGDIEEMVASVERLQGVADLIDLNFGCPAPKVTRHCAGAALMGEPTRLVEMVERCVEASQIPVTVKMRLGVSATQQNVVEIAKSVEAAGAQRICVHGRTLRQRYSGVADWQTIAEVVEAVNIPVVANGDIVDAASAAECLTVTGAAGLMIGRAAIGRPFIFARIKQALGWDYHTPEWHPQSLDNRSENDVALWRLAAWRRYLELVGEHERGGEKNILRHGISFTKGIDGGKALRVHLHENRDVAQVGERVEEFLTSKVLNP